MTCRMCWACDNGYRSNMMLSTRDIEKLRDRIVQALRPEKIFLFGSYATKRETSDSDIDLMVIMESDLAPHKRNIALKRLFPCRNFSLDAFVYTPQEYARYKDIPGTIIYNATNYGKLLYG